MPRAVHVADARLAEPVRDDPRARRSRDRRARTARRCSTPRLPRGSAARTRSSIPFLEQGLDRGAAADRRPRASCSRELRSCRSTRRDRSTRETLATAGTIAAAGGARDRQRPAATSSRSSSPRRCSSRCSRASRPAVAGPRRRRGVRVGGPGRRRRRRLRLPRARRRAARRRARRRDRPRHRRDRRHGDGEVRVPVARPRASEPSEFLAHANDVVVGEIEPGQVHHDGVRRRRPGRDRVECASAGHPRPRVDRARTARVECSTCGGLALGIDA